MTLDEKHYNWRFFIGVLILIFGLPLFAQAHPHVFIDTHIKVYFDDKGVSGFKMTWTFDALFTELMVDEFDEDFDEQFSKEEQKVIYAKAFTNLKKFNYFTEVVIQGKPLDIKYVTNFTAAIKNGVMQYSFFIPCHISANSTDKKVDVYTYDSSYYMDLSLTKESISFTKSQDYKITYQVADDSENRYYFEQISPQVLHLTFRR